MNDLRPFWSRAARATSARIAAGRWRRTDIIRSSRQFFDGHRNLWRAPLSSANSGTRRHARGRLRQHASSRSCTLRRRAWSANPSSSRRNIIPTTLSVRSPCWMPCAMRSVTVWYFSRPARSTGTPTARRCAKTIHVRRPIPYGASKWMIDRILADYRSAYGIAAFCLRYFNASGADASGGIGELRDNETHLIPRAMMALQGHVRDFTDELEHFQMHGNPARRNNASVSTR